MAKTAKQTIEQEMLSAVRSRKGEYDPDILTRLKQQGGSQIYMMLFATKARQMKALMTDILVGSGSEKPWTIRPTPSPELPPSEVSAITQAIYEETVQAEMMGLPLSVEDIRQKMLDARQTLEKRMLEQARMEAERAEVQIEDQLVEGSYLDALDQFIDDLTTFKTAFIEGPIVRRTPQLQWSEDGALVVETKLSLHWERRSPFDVYPAPWAKDISRDDLCIRYKLSRGDLNELIGVEGYSEASIRMALERFDNSGFREWLSIDSELAQAEGKDSSDHIGSGLIDAVRYFGSASGRMLRDWGLPAKDIADLDKEYQIEAWCVGHIVIKAVLNADPLSRRPLYGESFQKVPGSVWGNAPYDLIRDCQDMCNAAARSLAANLGISSGPQVAVLSNRIPSGEDVTEMYPWKIWQFESDPMGGTAAPITFFQPNSNANELMVVYERFSALADEYTGIPRYMAGFETAGAGRTASGMSMMIGNASKVIKQVLGGIDTNIITKVLERLFYYNMRYGTDPELKGDVKVVARGAASLATKEAAQVRTNEFLQATANPIDMQILGMDGRAELLRHSVKRLDLNPDKVVPPAQVLAQRAMQQQAMMAQQTMMGQGGAPQEKPDQEQLQNGAPVSDHFKPAGSP
jgi:hypothetical protein